MDKKNFKKNAVDWNAFAKEIIDVLDKDLELIQPGYYFGVDPIREILEGSDNVVDIVAGLKALIDDEDYLFEFDVFDDSVAAMEYLTKVDPSLRLSTEIALSQGHSIRSVTSVFLANLFIREDARGEFNEKWPSTVSEIESIAIKHKEDVG